MASLETVSSTGEISPRFDKLLKDVTTELNPDELKHVVLSIKSNFKGKYEDQEEQDLYSCLQLFANQGLVSEDNLTLLERFVTPKTSKKGRIEEKIQAFKQIRLRQVKTKDELTGRDRDLEKVMTKLTTDSSSVVNLYGTSGVGKTTLAIETLSKWSGRKFKADLRGINEMKDVHFHVLNALTGSERTVVSYEANPIIGQMRQLKRDSQSDILLLLDNVDRFVDGDGEKANFFTLLQRLLGPKTDRGKSAKLKILLTSRTALRHGDSLDVENYEVKALDKAFSSALLHTQGTPSHGTPGLKGNEREKLAEMCQGNPLILNGMAAILRQEIADAEELLKAMELHEQVVVEPPETGLPPTEKDEKEIFDAEKEGIDKEQENCLRKIFFFLPSPSLKDSSISVSLFCRPFSTEAAATILGVDSLEAVVQLERLRNSKVLSRVDPGVDQEAKELYDIHPLLRKFLRSIGTSKAYIKVYQKARDRFCNLFISQIKDISALLDKDYIGAFNRFDLDKANFELALDISLKSDYLLIPTEHHESIMICYLFEAMLNEKQRRKIFNSWAEKAEEDGKKGSILRAELKCREALQVLRLEGWQRALEVLKMAEESLDAVQKESKGTDFFRLTRSSYLFVEGEVYYRAGNMAKALRILHRSLKIMEDILKSHTSTSRCLNAIGNCHNKLGKPDEAIKYYTRAFDMRKELSGSTNHFDMPFFKGQIGTAYEGKKQFHEAIEFYQEALELSKELKIPGMVNTALYNRNIANAYSWLREFKKAYQPAKNAYEIRKDILGKHPWTARSAFQMAEICRSLEEFDEAEGFYEEAWQIEKSLGQGNHSEVMVRIVQSYEAMLRGVRKEEFQKETFEFYQCYWDEERNFEGFEFSPANKKVIDSINERLSDFGDRQTQKKYKEEALWFYEGAWNSPDTKKLPYLQRKDILQTLCNMSREKDLYNKYEGEAFRFYEKQWKRMRKEKVERQDMIDILTTLQRFASSLKNEKKEQKYGKLLKETKQSGSFSSTIRSLLSFGSAAEQMSSDDDSDSDNGDEELQLEEEDPDKITIHEGTLTSEGTHLDLKQGAVHMRFPCDAVSEPTSIVVHRWKSSACSPQLQDHEAIVSNVIEISTDRQEPLEFSADVKLVLSHSAPNLHGYELVLFKLTDKESNEWKDIAGTEDFRSLSDIEDEYPSAEDIPDFYFPVVQAEITECSTYAVVCRLKLSPPYTITSKGGSFNLPDYPSVSVTIPENAVAPEANIPLQIKVQEVPGEEFDGKDILVGPILRICCTEVVEFLKPVTIHLPVSLEDKQHKIPGDQSACRVRVLCLRSDGEQKEWVEITDDLKNPATFNGKIVTFQVERFSGYTYIVDLCTRFFTGVIGYMSNLIRNQPLLAVFFAYFRPVKRPDSRDTVLYLICCPSHLGDPVAYTIERRGILKFLCESDSIIKMIPGHDKAYVSLSGGIRAVDEDDIDNFHLRFERKRYVRPVPVRVTSDKGLSGVKFYNSPKHDEDRHLLCDLNFESSLLKRNLKDDSLEETPVEFFGVPISDQTLLEADPERKAYMDSSPCTTTVVGTSHGSPAEENPGMSNIALRVTLLASEWSSSKGGLSTINRQLAILLAKHKQVEVTLLVPQSACSEKDQMAARSHNVSIREAVKRPGYDSLDCLSFPPDDHTIDIVLGHGGKLGKQGQFIRKSHRCKWVQVVHTSPEERGMHKNDPGAISKDEEKYRTEIDLCKLSDLVVAVGPKLTNAYSSYLRSCEKHKDIFQLTPGTFSEFAAVKQATNESDTFKVLIFGRGDPEDFSLKGYDIAAKAIVELKDSSYRLIYVGAPAGKQDEVAEILLQSGISKDQLFVRKFVQSKDRLKELFCEVDLAIMPSRTEGFGLTALEAMSAGLPILVSGNSGFAVALCALPLGKPFVVESDDPKEWANAIMAVRQKNRAERLEEIQRLRTCYEEHYSWERQCEYLVEKMWSIVHAKQAASKSEEEEEEEIVVESEEEIDVGSVEGSKKEIKVGSEDEEIVDGSEEEIDVASEEENEVGAEDSEIENRRTIFKGTVTSEGTHWDLKQGAVHMTFPRDAVSEPTSIVVHRWKSRACSPQLQEHEAIVSNVIEISTDNQEPLKFSADVKLVLSHSAPKLHGYELVVFMLTDKERNEWEEIAETEDFRSLSDIEDECPSAKDIPDFYFPVVQAEITECSKYAVVCRLKSSPPYTITSKGGSFNLPDYPSVSVTIPKKAVAAEANIPLQIKVQEVPGEEFDGKDILVGPILRICCTEVVEFLKPVTIQLPVSLGDKQHQIADLSACRVRVLFLRSDGEQKEWVEITDDLKNPASFDGKIVTFQVERFSGYMCLLDWCKKYFSISEAIGYLSCLIWNQPQLAVFFAYFRPEERPDLRDTVLYLTCCPSHLRDPVANKIERGNFKSLSESDSIVKMIPGHDKAYVSLSGGIRAVDEDDMDNFYLRFERERHRQQVPVHVISDKKLSVVKFYNSPQNDEDRHLLCRLVVRLPLLKIDFKDSSPYTTTVVRTSQGSPAQGNPGTSDTALRVTLLASEWSSSMGGLSTINRQLAILLAKHMQVEVTFLVPQFSCSEEEKRAARSHNVSIREAKRLPGYDPLDWLSFPPDDLAIDIVLGHGGKLGKQTQVIRGSHSCKCVQVVHTAPEELGMYKNYPGAISKGEEKNRTEVDLCKLANLVVTVGHKLTEAYSSYLRSCKERQDIIQLTPGTFSEFAAVKQATNERDMFKVLIFGRGDPEDFKLKGYDIAAKAIVELRDRSYCLIFVGAPEGKQEEVAKNLLQSGISKNQLIVRTFVQSKKKFKELFCEVDLAIMPSRTEGFGLTALEALSAGLPILVSGNSGFAVALRDLPLGKPFVVESDDPNEWANAIMAVRQKNRTERLEEIQRLRTCYEERYSWERQCKDLVQKMWSIVHAEEKEETDGI